MDTVTAYAQGVVKDLRQRGLLPVAAFLVAALIALPVLMLKSSEPVSAPPAEPTAASADGLPSPEEALGAAGKPLVSLAVLDRPSDLDSFESKDPFEPIDQVSADGATQGTVAPTASRWQQLRRQQLRRQLPVDRAPAAAVVAARPRPAVLPHRAAAPRLHRSLRRPRAPSPRRRSASSPTCWMPP